MGRSCAVLYLDNDVNLRNLVCQVLADSQYGYRFVGKNLLEDCLEILLQDKFDIVLTGLDIRWDAGLKIIDFVRTRCPTVPIIALSQSRSEELAVEAMKRGADDYILKNKYNISFLPSIIQNALRKKKVEAKFGFSQKGPGESEEIYRMIFELSPMGIFYFDENGVIKNCNQSLLDVLQSQKRWVVGFEILSRSKSGAFKECVRKVLLGERSYYEGDFWKKRKATGSIFKVSMFPVPDKYKCSIAGIAVVDKVSPPEETGDWLQT